MTDLRSSSRLGIIYVPVDQHLVQACLNDSGDQSTVVSSDSLSTMTLQYHLTPHLPSTYLNALRIHLIILLRPCPIQSRIPLLVDQQIREIDLLKLELDRSLKFCRYKVRRFTTKPHDRLQICGSELHHYGIRIAVYDLGVVLLTVIDSVVCFDFLPRPFDHCSTIGGDTRRDRETWKLSDRRSSKTVHGVGTNLTKMSVHGSGGCGSTHLQGELPAIQHSLLERIRLFLQIRFRSLPSRDQVVQNRRQ